MKSTGIVRKIDHLGRFVLPKELRSTLDIKENDPMEMYINNNTIVVKKYSPGCFVCGEIKNTLKFKDKIICKVCINDISKIND